MAPALRRSGAVVVGLAILAGSWALLRRGPAAGTAVTAAGPAGHVLLISIDGFAAYHLQDESLALPNIRALAAAGAAAEASETVFPSVTHPSHTTIVTGVSPRVHGVLNNVMVDRRTGQRFHATNRPRTELVKVPTLFDAARKQGLSTASFYWPETKDDPAIDFNVPEVFEDDTGQRPEIRAVPPGVLAELRAAGVPIEQFYRLYGGPLASAADEALTQAAVHAIRTLRPGLLAIHFVSTDDAQHEHGPGHYLARAALTHADYLVGLLRDAVAAGGIADRTAFFIVADHGFHSVTRELNVAPIFAALLDGPAGPRIRLHPGGWTTYVERLPKFDSARDGALLEAALERAESTPGIARVIRSQDFHVLGLPRYEESPYIAGEHAVIGDIDTYLVVRPGEPMTGPQPKAGPSHSHGYLPDHERMRPAFVMSGAGVAGGVRLGRVRNYDVAPTIAALLGLDMGELPGRVLQEGLR